MLDFEADPQAFAASVQFEQTLAIALPAALAADWAVFGLADDVRPALARAAEAGEPAALATLFAAHGGAPRGIGAQMLVTAREAAGYLSGGCVEADVARHALAAVGDGMPRWLVYGPGGPVDVRLPCGGQIEVLVERIAPDDAGVRMLLAAAEARRPAIWLSDGVRRTVVPGMSLVSPEAAAREAQRSGCAAGIDPATQTVFRTFRPRFRVVIIGADPTALAMATLAVQCGLETFLVRPKGPPEPPPVAGVRYLTAAVPEALSEIGLDMWTAVATTTHDDIDDHEALVVALPSAASYVGLLGSRRRLQTRLEGLRAAGVSEDSIARLRAPIGFDLGGSAPFEIALGTVAEMVQVLNAASKAADAGPPMPEQA